MERADVVIIGGSAAGATAAVSCKRRNPDKSIILVRKEEQVSIPCGIPYIFGTVGSPQKNLIPDTLLTNIGVKIIIGTVEGIDRKKKVVRTTQGELGYEKLILAMGSSPVVLPIPGIEKENVFIVKKDVAYLQKMLEAINSAKDIVILGGGFIGAEFADECKKNRQANVTIVEKLPHCLQLAFDDEFCIEAEKVLTDRSINIVCNESIAEIIGDNKVKAVRLESGKEIKADVVIISIGVSPNTELAKKAGLPIDNASGGIVVDRYQRVEGDTNILACGDCAMKVSFFQWHALRRPGWLLSLPTKHAWRQLTLLRTQYAGLGAVGVFSTQIGELAIAAAGLTERQALAEGYNIVIGQAKAPSKHPGGMPGAVTDLRKTYFLERRRRRCSAAKLQAAFPWVSLSM